MKKKETLIWLLVLCFIFGACWTAARTFRAAAPQEVSAQTEEAPAPAEEASAPEEEQAPAEEAPAPEEESAPTEETPAPEEEQAPAEETPAPEEAQAPAEETPAPEEEPAPAEEEPAPEEEPAADWTREGYFQDENGNVLSVTRMDDVAVPGWYVGCTLGEDLMDDSYGGVLRQEGKALKGTLSGWHESIEALTVTVSENDEDGLLLAVEGGESYSFTPMEEQEDFDGQNPVMNFIGEYQCDRAHAKVACFGRDEAQITIEWGGSASELARWDIIGRLDTKTLTVAYSGCTKSIEVYQEGGELVSSTPEYEDGTGTIVFNNDGTFTWHEDQSVSGEDMLFEWVPVVSASVESAPAEERPAVQVGVL